jgi:hypothetical protein
VTRSMSLRRPRVAAAITAVLAAAATGLLLLPSGEASPAATSDQAALANSLQQARIATAKYAFDLDRARSDGYRVITPNMPDMGFHFLNPGISGDFDVTKPPILVYVKKGNKVQLGALEWVFGSTPATPPLPGATYGSFPAACHYDDGSFIPAASQDACAPTSPSTGSAFFFWHPQLVTLHVWLWYPNPDGLYSSTNAFVHPFTRHSDLIGGGSTGDMKGMANMPGMSHG